jgi:hypothetical protein
VFLALSFIVLALLFFVARANVGYWTVDAQHAGLRGHRMSLAMNLLLFALVLISASAQWFIGAVRLAVCPAAKLPSLASLAPSPARRC